MNYMPRDIRCSPARRAECDRMYCTSKLEDLPSTTKAFLARGSRTRPGFQGAFAEVRQGDEVAAARRFSDPHIGVNAGHDPERAVGA
jgi:hypothetical protein